MVPLPWAWLHTSQWSSLCLPYTTSFAPMKSPWQAPMNIALYWHEFSPKVWNFHETLTFHRVLPMKLFLWNFHENSFMGITEALKSTWKWHDSTFDLWNVNVSWVLCYEIPMIMLVFFMANSWGIKLVVHSSSQYHSFVLRLFQPLPNRTLAGNACDHVV